LTKVVVVIVVIVMVVMAAAVVVERYQVVVVYHSVMVRKDNDHRSTLVMMTNFDCLVGKVRRLGTTINPRGGSVVVVGSHIDRSDGDWVANSMVVD
jgi:hypothetical protein